MLAILAGTSVRQVLTFSVIPSDSTMIMYDPASRKRCACMIAPSGSLVPSAASSSALVAPPAPNWIPISGLAFSPAF